MLTNMSSLQENITHVIFDLDGLLINSENFYEAADKVVLQALGKAYSLDLEWKLRGRTALDCAQMIVDYYDLDMTAEEWNSLVKDEQSKMFPSSRPMPGIIKVLHHLFKNKIPCAIATSCTFKTVAQKTDHLKGLIGYFHHIVSLNDPEVNHGKPDPDVFLVAKNRFHQGDTIRNENCLVFEDAVNGIKAASRAQMRAIFIPDPKMPLDVALAVDGYPSATLRSAHDFKPELFGLPPYSYQPVTHVIFDVDGLLLDTGKLLDSATQEILSNHGKAELDWEQRVELMGKRRADMIENMIELYDLPMTTEELNDEYSSLVEPMYSQCKMLEGAARLIRHLKAKGIPIAVATSSSSETLAEKTKNHRKVFDLFHHVVTGSHSELKNGKPAPDIFLICAQLFDEAPIEPKKVLVLEDAPNGIHAAFEAGMQSVMVPHKNLAPQYTLQATQVIHSLLDFHPEDFGLPPFKH